MQTDCCFASVVRGGGRDADAVDADAVGRIWNVESDVVDIDSGGQLLSGKVHTRSR